MIFEGPVRNHQESRGMSRLRDHHHSVLAKKEGERIVAETLGKFPITGALAFQRSGILVIGACPVASLTRSPHREEAFEANRFLIDSIKARVPIWKEETYATGEVEWSSPCPNCGPVPDIS